MSTVCRESYDIAVSRAVARLNILSELCLPYVKVGGCFVAMKGQLADVELDEAKQRHRGFSAGAVERVYEYEVARRHPPRGRHPQGSPHAVQNIPAPLPKSKRRPL